MTWLDEDWLVKGKLCVIQRKLYKYLANYIHLHVWPDEPPEEVCAATLGKGGLVIHLMNVLWETAVSW